MISVSRSREEGGDGDGGTSDDAMSSPSCICCKQSGGSGGEWGTIDPLMFAASGLGGAGSSKEPLALSNEQEGECKISN